MEKVETSVRSPTANSETASVQSARWSWNNGWKLSLAILAMTMIAVVLVTSNRSSSTSNKLTKADVAKTAQTIVDKALADAAKAPVRSAVAYQSIAPSMVVIKTDQALSGAASSASTKGLGAGVIINTEGSILTANHVIAGAKSIRLTFADGTEADGQVVSSEPDKDIAIVQADTTPEVIVPAVMGGGLQVGDEVFAIGHPLGLTDSLSAGVVSGLGRSIPMQNGKSLDDLIQFDAAVNPGSSGGPLLNRNGQVVGIVTALANPSEQGFFVGIGFAVPIATAGGAAGAPPR
jgi:S1-C subfamily serine protease